MARNGTTAKRRSGGFSRVELVITVAVIALLAGVVVPVVGDKVAASRDARRLQDCQTVVEAIERFQADKGELPLHDGELACGGWDTSLDGAMLSVLFEGGYLREPLRDPLNDADHHYRYCRYNAGYEGFAADFYVLGVRGWESEGYATTMHGGWAGSTRNWGDEFAYVTGGTAR